MTDRLNEHFQKQLDFLKVLNHDPEPMNQADRIAETKRLLAHAMTELIEALDKVPFKSNQPLRSNIIIRNGILEELIDAYKLIMAAALTWGFTDEDWHRAFMAKSNVVYQKYVQERTIQELVQSGKPLVVLDLDGVLLNTHGDWLSYLSERSIHVFDTREQARVILGTPTYERHKDQYRRKNKRYVKQFSDAGPFTKWFREHGYGILIVTARPFARYMNLWADTMFSLAGCEFDAIMFDSNKRTKVGDIINNVEIVVEDDMDHAISLLTDDNRVYLVKNMENEGRRSYSQITEVNTLWDIVDLEESLL